MCREFEPEFAVVAHSWRKAHPHSDGVFFARLDFAEGRPIFMRVRSSYQHPFDLFLPVWDPICSECMGISTYKRSDVKVVIQQSTSYI
jgi:hypothetical protein